MRYSSREYDVEAWIEYIADSSKLPEHREERVAATGDEKFAMQRGYLEIEEGKDFRIHYTVHKPKKVASSYHFKPLLDGRSIQGGLIQSNSYPTGYVEYMNVEERGEIRRGRLTFSALQKTSEEAEVQVRGKVVDDLCTIELQVVVGTAIPKVETTFKYGAKASIGKVHEKQLKLGSTIAPRETEPMPPMRLSSFHERSHRPEVCKFVWKYFIKDMLIIKGIIEDDRPPPRDRSPSPHPSDGDRAAAQLKKEDLEDVKPNVGNRSARQKRKRDSTSNDKQHPVHGSASRPFKIDNEDSDDEVMLDLVAAKMKKKRVSETADLMD